MLNDVAVNRRKFIDGLRFNPNGYTRITGNLTNHGLGRCAIGAGCEYLGISLATASSFSTGIYDAFEKALDLDDSSLVYRMNDNKRLSYAEVADEMAENWGMA